MNASILYLIQILKSARKAKKLTQKKLAKKAGIPQGYISKIEKGSVNITLASFVELARNLELEVMLLPRQEANLIKSIILSEKAGRPLDKTPAYVPDNVDDEEDVERNHV